MIMDFLENVIEIHYRKLADRFTTDYEFLYQDLGNDKLKIMLSTLHSEVTELFDKMNTRLPSGDDGNYYWAEPSRQLISAIEVSRQLEEAVKSTHLEFQIEPYYKNLFHKCMDFLSVSYGSAIPSNMEKVNLYYTLPIFVFSNKGVFVDMPKIKTITSEYIKTLAERANKDISEKSYDSAITKSRTLLEEVFCHVIELRGEEKEAKGDIGKLYKQVKRLYNMHGDKTTDSRINMLLSGLENIIKAVAEMRNANSDAHGVGSKRKNIEEHHARLFLNASVAMSDFILSVGENNKRTTTP